MLPVCRGRRVPRPHTWRQMAALMSRGTRGCVSAWAAQKKKEVAGFDGGKCARCEQMLGYCDKNWICAFCFAKQYLHGCRRHAHWSDKAIGVVIRWAMGTACRILGTSTGWGRYILTCIPNHHDNEQPDFLLLFLHLVAVRLMELRKTTHHRAFGLWPPF